MRFGPTGISVTPAERYANAVGNCWPVAIMPAPGELLSSWLHRLAYANGVPPHYFGALLGAPGENWSARLDRALPDRILRLLEEHTHIPLEDIAALTVALEFDLLTFGQDDVPFFSCFNGNTSSNAFFCNFNTANGQSR